MFGNMNISFYNYFSPGLFKVFGSILTTLKLARLMIIQPDHGA